MEKHHFDFNSYHHKKIRGTQITEYFRKESNKLKFQMMPSTHMENIPKKNILYIQILMDYLSMINS
jgi:hypothetical protein